MKASINKTEVMIQVTKIFKFEMAHAIYGYDGPCKNIHGHSYVLHVSVTLRNATDEYLLAPGFVIDFKMLKKIVNEAIVQQLDHSVVVSKAFIQAHPQLADLSNVRIWEMEPSAENIISYIQKQLQLLLPDAIQLQKLQLFETADSYAEWINTKSRFHE
ncbi:MAG: 6-carboxytetrahydropterin synthase QueD [Hydrotalea flava]|uniref:6-pyruvoyl trahydropterin synthase family protein n=1 Tax=Hydrotalea flava TaxID=714549 RepID=UPI000F918707|nr:6-carboxytetrahydropterin synthase [Hydrotalea flava]RTL47621.1 MAG: 6-carboxytetrahydropterin synthase [Sphingobacteriales bacterium]NIM34436.1 6-carboxytetrahydropterin synthase QueD [Hydrotalea flava]NIM37267.1 6-carboxytetrahydropterin synthase QueD [Hydrotalea flava]NIN02455.1 6-carboxytetrahydropterin synthase QueD [Hydrotalea flava]NIN14112.1 6-carboxytetrahydropterin synthase QueD [Hydrotalea flava]